MTLPPFLAQATMNWGSYYGDHRLVSVTIRYLHLVGIVLGGGAALAGDRDTLRAVRRSLDDRRAALARLAAAHRVVIPALVVVFTTGGMMAAADLETFMASRLFWIKMGLVALLAINGAALVAAERAAAANRSSRAWTTLALTSGASLLLWLMLLLAGTWLTVAA